LATKVFHKHLPGGQGLAATLINRAPFASLEWEQRQKSRLHAIDSQGNEVAIFIERGKVLRAKDILVGEDGSFLRIESAPQALLKISACPIHSAPHDLMRAAYHLGNRHIPIEVQAKCLHIELDHVLEQMILKMGLIVEHVHCAFEPESGAYGEHNSGHANGHKHEVTHPHHENESHDHDNHDHGIHHSHHHHN
jgi:urease accessory protein